MFRFFLVIFFCTFHLAAATPIVVNLHTEAELVPVYLATHGDDTFGRQYLQELDKVAQFDFNHNGKTKVVTKSQELNRLASQDAFKEEKHLKEWREQGINMVVTLAVRNGALQAEVVLVDSKQVKHVEGLSLTGDLSRDRRTVHALADTVLQAFFGVPGVANSRIAYTVKHRISATKEVAEVWEADYDGANAVKLTNENALCVTPVYVPADNGMKSHAVCYVSYETGQPKIKMVNTKTGACRSLFRLRGQQLMPTFTPQRDHLAFITDITGNPDLFLIDFDPQLNVTGKPRQIFGTRYSTQGSPSFSPDGRQVVFVSNKDGRPRLYVMPVPAPGTPAEKIKPALITKRPTQCTAPAWSPDGTKIAYCSRTHGVRQIWIYDIAAGKERQITWGNVNKENPAWAKNSLHLLYNAGSEGHGEIYLIDIVHKNPVQITRGKGEKRFPIWN